MALSQAGRELMLIASGIRNNSELSHFATRVGSMLEIGRLTCFCCINHAEIRSKQPLRGALILQAQSSRRGRIRFGDKTPGRRPGAMCRAS